MLGKMGEDNSSQSLRFLSRRNLINATLWTLTSFLISQPHNDYIIRTRCMKTSVILVKREEEWGFQELREHSEVPAETGSTRHESREERDIPSHKSWAKRKSSYWAEWRHHLGSWWCYIEWTQALPKMCVWLLRGASWKVFQRCLSLSDQRESQFQRLPLTWFSLTHLDGTNVDSLPPPSMVLVLAPPWRPLLLQ